MLLTTDFAYRKGLSVPVTDLLLCEYHTLKSSLESGLDARIDMVNHIFDMVNH